MPASPPEPRPIIAPSRCRLIPHSRPRDMRRWGGAYSYGGGISVRTTTVCGGGWYTTGGGGGRAGDAGAAGGASSSGEGSGCSGCPAGAACCWGAFVQNQLPGGHEAPPAACAAATVGNASP